MSEDNKNLLIFFVVSTLILVGYPYVFNNQAALNVQTSREQISLSQPIAPPETKIIETSVVSEKEKKKFVPEKIINISTKHLSGSISSYGAKIDHVVLNDYDKSLKNNDNQKIAVLDRMKRDYFAYTAWQSDDQSIPLPNETTQWEASDINLSVDKGVVLSWDNQQGLLFEKHISVDDQYIIVVTDKIKNYGTKNVKLKHTSLISKAIEQEATNEWTFYEGPIGYFNGKLENIAYSDISDKKEIKHETNGGWYGITDKYWLVAFVDDESINSVVNYKHNSLPGKNVYKIESVSKEVIVLPTANYSHDQRLFVGAKEINTLDKYEEKLGIKHFDLAIDFGWLYFITKPLLYALAYIKDIVGNMGLGIIILTLLLKILLAPLANKSYKSMNRMKDVQPKIQEIQKRYADDKVKLGQEISALYKKENINPVGGCLPTLLQSPILFALYKVLYISIEMRHAPFVGWISDLSMPDTMFIFNLFGLMPVELPSFLQIGVWPILMGLSMFLQQKIGPTPSDPSQAIMMLIMPIMFTFMFAHLPSGLVIYWTFSNVFSIVQQYIVTKNEGKNPHPKKCAE